MITARNYTKVFISMIAVIGGLQAYAADYSFKFPADSGGQPSITVVPGSYSFQVDADPDAHYMVHWFDTYSGESPPALTKTHFYYYDNYTFSLSESGWVRAEIYNAKFTASGWVEDGWVGVYRWDVTVNNPPNTPSNLQVDSSTIDHDSAKVTWDDNGDPDNDTVHFRVEYGKTYSWDDWTEAEDDTTSEYETITGLDSETWYTVRVFAFDNKGGESGELKKTALFKTKEVHSVGVPDKPSASKTTAYRGESITFNTGGSSCSWDHSVQYEFDYGDGDDSTWGGTSRSHSYDTKGSYSVTARARCSDTTTIRSDWSSGRSVTINGWPDLQVEDIWTDPANPVLGQDYDIYVSVKNHGDEDANPAALQYIWTRIKVDGADVGNSNGKAGNWVNKIEPNETREYRISNITAPSSGTSISIEAWADTSSDSGGNNQVDERTDEDNNKGSATITLSAPNLTIESDSDIWIEPSKLYHGEKYRVHVRVKNIGNADADAGVGNYIRTLISVPGDSDNANPPGTLEYSIPQDGESIYVSKEFTAPSSGSSFSVTAQCDSQDDIPESNPDDNSRSVSFNLYVPSGDIAATVKNQHGSIEPNSKVKLYSSSWSFLQEKTAPSGTATFDDLPLGTYNFEAYNSYGEYWCYGTKTISTAGGSASIELKRNEPYADGSLGITVDGANVIGGVADVGKEMVYSLDILNDSPVARAVTMYLKLRLDGGPEFSGGSDTITIASGDTESFDVRYTPTERGLLECRYDINTQTANGNPLTDHNGWGNGVTIYTTVPQADPASISGIPPAIQPGKRYTVSADYTDANGRDDLKYVYLTLANDNEPAGDSHDLTLMWGLDPDYPAEAWEEDQEFIVPVSVTKSEISNGYRVTWTFYLLGYWNESSSGVSFGINAVDSKDQSSGFNYRNPATSFAVPSLPAGKWTIIAHGRTTGFGGWDYDDLTSPEYENGGGLLSERKGYIYRLALELKKRDPSRIQIHWMNHENMTIEPSWSDSDGKHHVLMYDWTLISDYIHDPEIAIWQPVVIPLALQIGGPAAVALVETMILTLDRPPIDSSNDGYDYASADALAALLAKNDLSDKTHLLIGHSRGGILCSETAQRLLRRPNNNLKQVIYLDPEGEGGTFADYIDQEFWAWEGVRTDNFYNGGGPEGIGEILGAVGEHDLPQANSVGIDLYRQDDPNKKYGHSLDIYLGDYLYFTQGDVVGGTAPILMTPHSIISKNTSSRPLDLSPDTPSVIHGDFEFGSYAGWAYHGGSGALTWTDLPDALDLDKIDGNYLLKLDGDLEGDGALTHNWQVVPTGTKSVRFDLAFNDVLFETDDYFGVKWNNTRYAWIGSGLMSPELREQAVALPGITDVGRLTFDTYFQAYDAWFELDNIEFLTMEQPSVSTFFVGPSAVNQGMDLTFTAGGVASDPLTSVEQVTFYWDADSNGTFDNRTDVPYAIMLGNSSNTWQIPSVSSAALPIGSHWFFAVATDAEGLSSEALRSASQVSVQQPVNQLPVIDDLDCAGSVDRGDSLALTATGVLDPDGTVARVEFYYDSNKNGAYDEGDTKLSPDDTTIDIQTATINVDTGTLPAGTAMFFAIAYDNLGAASGWASCRSTIVQKWQLSYSVTPSGGGTVNPNPAVGSYPDGTKVQPSASANAEYSFVRWETNGDTTDLPFWLHEDTTVSAVFQYVGGGGGTVAPVINTIGPQSVAEDSPFSFVPTLQQGDGSITWSLGSKPDGMTINATSGQISWPDPTPGGSANIVTVKAANSAGSYTESFTLYVTAPRYTLTVIDGSPSGEYPEDGKVTITAEQKPDGVFSHWIGAIGHLDNPNASPTVVTMPAEPVTVDAEFRDAPDLIATNGTYEAKRYLHGDSLSVSVTETNIGTAAVSGPFAVHLALSTDTVWSNGNDYVVATNHVNGMALNSGLIATLGCTIPTNATIPDGFYYVGVMIDATNSILEIKEDNNVWWSSAADVEIHTQPPLEAINRSPVGVGADRDVTLRWVDDGGYASSYRVLFGTSPASLNMYPDGAPLGTNYYRIGMREPNTTYWWKVVSMNNDGATTNSVAVSFTTEDVPSFSEATDNKLAWTTSNNVPWFAQTNTTHDGVDAMQSGAISHNGTSVLETTIQGPGTLSFWWKVDSEPEQDWLDLLITGTTNTGISGPVDWMQENIEVPFGRQTLQWRYGKDASGVNGLDAAWLDEVDWNPVTTVTYPLSGFTGKNTAVYLWHHEAQSWTFLQQGTNISQVALDNILLGDWYWLVVMEYDAASGQWKPAHTSWINITEAW